MNSNRSFRTQSRTDSAFASRPNSGVNNVHGKYETYNNNKSSTNHLEFTNNSESNIENSNLSFKGFRPSSAPVRRFDLSLN